MRTTIITCLAVLGVTLFSSSASCGEADELYVMLGSELALLPTYVQTIDSKDPTLSPDYVKQLKTVLEFDLNNNGMTRIVSGKDKDLITAALAGKESAADIEALRKQTLSYLLQWKVQREVEVQVVNITEGTTRTIRGGSFTGDMVKDRAKIHQVADSIFQTLFQKPGIASTKIAYIVRKKGEKGITTSEVYVADYDGHNARQLTHTRSLCATPAWIPQRISGLAAGDTLPRHQSLVYVSYELGQPKLFGVSIRDGHTYRISTMRGNQLTPTISSDGSAIAFCSDITGTADLFYAPFEGGIGVIGKPRQIFHVKGTATGCPTFSPDGKKIAFVSNKDGSAKIYTLDIPEPGTKPEDLKPVLMTKRCRENTAPAWSPDGKKIAYTAKNGGDRQIWIYDLERHTEQQLTDTKGNKESPSWAPDSMHIVFHATNGANCDIYMASINQPKPVKIVSGNGDALFPVWEKS